MVARNKQNEISVSKNRGISCTISDTSYAAIESDSAGFLHGFLQTPDKKFFKRVKKGLNKNDFSNIMKGGEYERKHL